MGDVQLTMAKTSCKILRFSVRRLLLAVGVIGSIFGLAAHEYRRAYMQHESLLAISPRCEMANAVSRWSGEPFVVTVPSAAASGYVWEEISRKIIDVGLIGEPIPVSALDAIGHLSDLESLFLRDISVSADIVKRVDSAVSIRELSFGYCSFDDEAVVALGHIRHLRKVSILGGPGLSESQARTFARTSNIEELQIAGESVSANAFHELLSLAKLKSLEIVARSLSEPELRTLGGLRGLRSLTMNRVGIPSGGLRVIEGLSGLQTLEFVLMPIETINVANLRNLRSVTMFECEVDSLASLDLPLTLEALIVPGIILKPGEVKPLSKMLALQRLRFNAIDLSSEELLQLSSIPGLRELGLHGDTLTDKQTSELKRLLPNCKVSRFKEGQEKAN